MQFKLFKSFQILKYSLILSFGIVSITSCKPEYKEDEIPSYIHTSDYVLNTEGKTESSSKFTDCWISAGTVFIGAFEYPSTVPILNSGLTTLFIYPGVKENGISLTRTIYPFYDVFRKDTTLTRKEVLKIKPIYKLKQNTKFAINENFENPISVLEVNDTSSAKFEIKNGLADNNYSKGNYLEVQLSDTNQQFRLRSKEIFNKLGYTKPCWMEISFNTEVVIHTYIQAINLSVNDITTYEYVDLNKTSGAWNKVYINFTDITNNKGAGYSYRIYFTADYNNTQKTSIVKMDNIKLLYLE